jgi:hypothetical protein
VVVRRSVVDATVLASRVPATEPPPFDVAEGARCVPVGELVRVTEPPAGFVIIGAGKTAMDACTWLLERGTPPDAITWIRPRDGWLLNRANFQPGPGAIATLEGAVLELEAVAASGSVVEAYERLEQEEVMLRVDPSVRPTMGKGPTVSVAELQQLRRIGNVIRLGHVRRIERDQIVLDQGAIPTSPGHLHVHCAALGLPRVVPRPIFTDDTITLQCITRQSPTLSAALAGFVETTGRSPTEKNRLLPPNPYSDTPFDFLRAVVVGMGTEAGWGAAPDVQAWMNDSRLNVVKDLESTDDRTRLQDLQGRFLTALFPALEKIQQFAAAATQSEQELVFHADDDPAA